MHELVNANNAFISECSVVWDVTKVRSPATLITAAATLIKAKVTLTRVVSALIKVVATER